MRNVKKGFKIVMNLIFLLITIVLVCACQPTPSRTAVVYGGGLEEKIEGSPAPLGVYDAPAYWRETLYIAGSDKKIEIDSSIGVPEVTAFPVYKVKQATFDEARIKPLVDYFAKGRDVYKTHEATKAEIEKQLILAKKNNDEEIVVELQKKIATAPETARAEKITDWNADQSPSGCFMTDNGEFAGISVRPNFFGYANGFIETERIVELNGEDKIGDVAISYENALEAGLSMLHEFGIDYMASSSLEKARRYSRLSNSTLAEYSERPVSKGYLLIFVRNIDGIAGITNNGVLFYGTDEFKYKAPFNPEEIQIYVDENGKTQSFAWFYPLTIEEKVNPNARLLPFNDIKQRVRDMLIFINSYDNGPVKVTSIDMNMAIIDLKDHPGEAIYVPAWFIHYNDTFYDPEISKNLQQENTLVLNAIDGGRVLELPVEACSPENRKQDGH